MDRLQNMILLMHVCPSFSFFLSFFLAIYLSLSLSLFLSFSLSLSIHSFFFSIFLDLVSLRPSHVPADEAAAAGLVTLTSIQALR